MQNLRLKVLKQYQRKKKKTTSKYMVINFTGSKSKSKF